MRLGVSEGTGDDRTHSVGIEDEDPHSWEREWPSKCSANTLAWGSPPTQRGGREAEGVQGALGQAESRPMALGEASMGARMIPFQGKEERGLVLGSMTGVKKRRKHKMKVGEGKYLAARPQEENREGRGLAVTTKVGGRCQHLGVLSLSARSPMES